MRFYNYMKILALLFLSMLVAGAPGSVWGGDAAGAIEQMKLIMKGNALDSSLPTSGGLPGMTDQAGGKVAGADPGEGAEADEDKDAQTACGPEAVMPVEVCELGQGLLCLNSPPFSVDGDHVVVLGTVDRRTSVFSHLKVYVQHEYTKIFNEVKIESWAESDCWEGAWSSSYDGCMDSKGFFGVNVPLSQFGPYTVMIDAVSVDGDALSKTVRTSRVVPVEISPENITLNPDPQEGEGPIEATRIRLIADLLGDCKFCDFIGTSTGGVMITVTNIIQTADGGAKTVVRQGNIAAAGSFDICVPVMAGVNELKVTACNAASGEDCPEVAGISFEVASSDVEINLISPDESKLIYDAGSYSVIPLKFSIGTYQPGGGECKEGDVVINWNRHEPVSLCPDVDGFYNARLTPEVGINIGTIDVAHGDNKVSRSFVVGWGKIVNPYIGPDSGWIDGAVAARAGSGYINETIRPLINDFLNSDNLKILVKDIMSAEDQEDKEDSDKSREKLKKQKLAEIKKEIPYCSAGEGLGGVKINLIGDVLLERGELERLTFERSGIGFKLDTEGFEIHLSLYRDEDGDNKPDGDVLPLMIAFRAAQVDGRLEIKSGDRPLILLTSRHTNCDYQSASYCEKKPALLVPQNIAGGATKGGAWVRCDDKGQQVSEDIREDCVGLNILNAHTGLLNQQVLDIINDVLYCQGSAELTYLVREGMKDNSFSIGCDRSKGDCGDTPSILRDRQIWVNFGMNPARGKINVDENGIEILASARFGNNEILTHLDDRAAEPGTGILVDPNISSPSLNGTGGDSVSLSLAGAWINELLYQMAFQKEGQGILDWGIDEFFFNGLGFDFVEQCDAFVPASADDVPSALCQLRPRVGELLGATLTTNNYFSAKHPLRMRLVGSRKVAPRVKIYRADVPYELPPVEGADEIRVEYRSAEIVELEIPDMEISFYALEIDEAAGRDVYGNPQTLVDTEAGPVIHSMIEDWPEAVPIIRAKATLILALEVGEVATLADDPSHLVLTLRPVPTLTEIVFKKVPGGNATMIPDESLLSAFREKLNFGIEIYGDPENPVTLKLPKALSVDLLEQFDPTDLLTRFGLEKMVWGREGLSLTFDHLSNHINIVFKPEFE